MSKSARESNIVNAILLLTAERGQLERRAKELGLDCWVSLDNYGTALSIRINTHGAKAFMNHDKTRCDSSIGYTSLADFDKDITAAVERLKKKGKR